MSFKPIYTETLSNENTCLDNLTAEKILIAKKELDALIFDKLQLKIQPYVSLDKIKIIIY